MKKNVILTVALLTLFLVIPNYGYPQEPAEKLVNIRMAVEFVTHAASAHVARSKGWFQDAGLNITAYDSYITGMALAAALVKGDIDVAYICLIPAINARANAGVPVKVVCGTHKYGYGLLVVPEKVKTVYDLEKSDIRIGCAREGSPTDALLHKMIDKYGLDKKNILNKVRRMPPPKVLLAMKMGQLDAGFCCEQFPSMGLKMGFEIHLAAEDLWPRMQGSVVVAREDLIREHPEAVEKIVRITERATRYLNEHPEEAAPIVARALSIAGKDILPVKLAKVAAGLEITPEAILRSITAGIKCSTAIDPEEIQATINNSAKLGYIKKAFPAEEILDLRFLEKLRTD